MLRAGCGKSEGDGAHEKHEGSAAGVQRRGMGRAGEKPDDLIQPSLSVGLIKETGSKGSREDQAPFLSEGWRGRGCTKGRRARQPKTSICHDGKEGGGIRSPHLLPGTLFSCARAHVGGGSESEPADGTLGA